MRAKSGEVPARKESLAVRFLYGTVCGRALLLVLTRPAFSRLAGRWLDSGMSRCLIDPFIRRHHIPLAGIEVPPGGFSSFNAFFTRKRTAVFFDRAMEHLTSPCDGYLSAFPIQKDGRFSIKHTLYSAAELLKDDTLAGQFAGGTALIFRLTPAHYHRYAYIDDAAVLCRRKIPGVLHCVRPAACERVPVYVQNCREYTVLDTRAFGLMIQMEVGALLVGRICNDNRRPHVLRGEEKGYFAFGGSTVVLLFQKDAVSLRPSLAQVLAKYPEVPVRAGAWIGVRHLR